MAVAHEYRLMHSEFLDRSQLDRDKAIWWHLRQKETCSQCGTREIEWDPEQGGNRHAYGAEIKRCRGCEVKQQAEESDLSGFGRGIYISMRRNQNPYG